MASSVPEGDAPTEEDYMQKAVQLYTGSKYLLAMKAYERALSTSQKELLVAPPYTPLESCDPVPQDVLFRYFILYCNMFGANAASANDKQAEDFLLYSLRKLEERGYVRGGLLTARIEDVAKCSMGSGSNSSIIDDEGMSFLVAVTLNNWGCLLIRRGDLDRAFYFLQLALNSALTEQLARIALLNMCVVHISKCSFQEARLTAIEVCKQEDNAEDNGITLCSGDGVNKDLDDLLIACAYFNLGIAGEYSSLPEAEKYYTDAECTIVGNPYQQWSKIIEDSHKRFQEIVQQRRNEAIARQAAAALDLDAILGLDFPMRQRVSGVSRKRASHRASRSLNMRGKAKSGASSATGDDKSDLFEPPPINDEVRWAILNKGLENLIVPLMGPREAQERVFGKDETYESPFSFVTFDSLRGVAMLSLLKETPLQIADEAERGCLTFAKRSVWSPFAPRHNQGFIIPQGKGKPNLVPSPVMAGIVKTIVPLPPMSEKTINDALRNVAGLKKVLNSRLSALVQAENAFEERWRATHMIKEALIAFNFVQDFVKLKEAMKTKRLVQQTLEKLCAKRIIRFLRMVVAAKKCSEVSALPLMRARHFEGAAVITLQKNARIWLAKRELQRRRAEKQAYIQRIARMQGMYRARVARASFLQYREERRNELLERAEHERREFAARQIQVAYRRHAFLLAKWRDTGQFKRYVLHHYRYSREHSATVIQKTFRGFLVRRVHGREVHVRRCYGRNCYRAAALRELATRIQAAFRGYLVRKRMKRAVKHHRVKLLAEEVGRLESHRHSAAVAIQCAYRVYVARRRAVELRALRDKERLLRRNRVYPEFRLEEQVY
ncbi:hypothetical protein, conserved [Trypanosoma brucei gambiense DAL972]|uniref:Uncharacterized protein n=1 Tax=Trypanosoma brucei gambiense (strain MHOM/CI/86/DAL972) TaxID=679716 RepID=C9ZWH3_TRYB9|nr:hypothetical protein, conserved [Trypanosoma brucei gambiense DAL972]CBH13762.1 hypothetical protein, conserved [Trypanosoma brucei gambiense DAL972]|eukprot:XP_011776038.1 hypothetical protein, conserved [Trypanosoma brucei gambiense DAL972]